jgi:hypothetical protein
MRYIKFALAALFAAALLTTTTLAATNTTVVAAPASDLGQWTFSLGGGGTTTLGAGSDTAVGVQFELGHDEKLLLPLTAGLRQGVAWDESDGSNWKFSTRLFSDWTVLRLGNIQLDVGGNTGLNYGTTGAPKWVAAPEVVGRLYLKEDIDTFVRVEYPFDLTEGHAENALTYTLGVRIRF